MRDIDDHKMERIRAAMINETGVALNRDQLRAALRAADLVPAQRLRDAEARAERLEKTLHLMDCYLGQGSPSGARRAYQEATTSQNTAPPRTAVYKVLINILGDRRS